MSTNKKLSERDSAISIIRTLRDADYIAYLAGGCVRDQLLGETPKDYDVATSGHPEDIKRLFKKTASVLMPDYSTNGARFLKSGKVMLRIPQSDSGAPAAD